MRGFDEFRGYTTRIGFDVETGQFGSIPIAHDFAPRGETSVIAQSFAKLRRRRQKVKAQYELSKVLTRMSPEEREDVGMTEVYAASGHM
jgi:hypothetical protein